MKREHYVGTPVERVEDLRLLRGKGQFVDDLHRDNLLHAAIARSPVAHGWVRSIDTADAKAMPGVHAVYTAKDVMAALEGALPKIPLRLAPLPELLPFEQHVIALDKVRYSGEPLAIVVAGSAAQAEDAADCILAEIEALPAVSDFSSAAQGKSLLFPAHGSNAAIHYTAHKGDARNATGAYVRREKFSVQRHSAVTMETRGLLAQWDAGSQRMTVYGAAKVPYFVRRTLAAALKLPLESVELIELDIGGGFGVRGEYYPEDFLVPFAALMLRRPVKWIEDRRENLLGTNHSRETECELEIVCERNGRIVALRGEVSVNCGAYMRSTGAVPPRNIPQFLSGPYDVPHVHVASTAWLTNKAPSGTYRGPGFFECDFFRERLFDMAARDLEIDPVEFRRMNLVTSSQMPYSLAFLNKPDRTEELDGGDYQVTLDHCLRQFGWNEKRPLQGKLIEGRYHGIAVGCYIEGTAAGPKETVRIEIGEDGLITIHVGSANKGQGLETVLTQIAADSLGVPLDCIRILHGSTTHLKEGFGSFHSRSTVMGGSAILIASGGLLDRIREAAAPVLRCSAREVELHPGLSAAFGTTMLTRAELGALKVQVTGEFPSEQRTYGYGAAAAHVTVDPRTGKVELIDYFTVQDIGRVINPLTAKGQLVGAVVQGLGGVFLEHLMYDAEGQLLTGTLADYLMPGASDYPRIRADVLENSPSPSNPLGAKGIGEGGIVPVAGVVSNAVAAALASLKVEPRALPLTPPHLWELIAGGA